MGATQLSTRQLGGSSVTRDDLDTTTTTKAVVAKLIAGTNISFSSTGVDAGTGDVTINASGGAGSGITRSVISTSGSATMGATALVDYVYLVTGAHTMSLPAAAGNTNRYTVKNNHSANITIDTAGAENVEGAASISIAPGSSVDIISDLTNWFVI